MRLNYNDIYYGNGIPYNNLLTEENSEIDEQIEGSNGDYFATMCFDNTELQPELLHLADMFEEMNLNEDQQSQLMSQVHNIVEKSRVWYLRKD